MKRALLGLLILTGCATAEPMIWLRVDGQSIPSNPALLERAKLDATVCQGEVAKSDNSAGEVPLLRRQENSNVVLRGCMAQRGYVLVPERMAEQRRAELIAAQKR
jgi:hypothetical protein